MIEHLVIALRAAGIDTDWRDLADVLWLAHVGQAAQSTTGSQPAPTSPSEDLALDIQDDPPAITSAARNTPTAESAAPRSQGRSSRQDVAALEARPPASAALPGRLQIGRALHPLKHKYPQGRAEFVDIEATVHQYCETKLLVPMLAAARKRWFTEVALVVDGGPTMVVWHETIAALADLLARQGAFERVTRWTLTGNRDAVFLTSTNGFGHDPQELLDYSGRRLILTVTDCVDDLWRGSVAWAVLRHWGNSAPTALMQMLPPRLWPATALGEADVEITSGPRGGPNRTLRLRPPWWWDDDAPPERSIPVVTLDQQRLGAWAQVIMGVAGVHITGVLTPPTHLTPAARTTSPTDPRVRLATFRATVSTEAFHLATLLSAVEVSLPVARLILNTLIPKAQQLHLAEVLAGGLLQESRHGNDTYDFVPGIRELLHESLTSTATIDVWRTVAPYLEAATGQRPPFSLLLSPDRATSEPEDTELAAIISALGDRLGLRGALAASSSRNRQSLADLGRSVFERLAPKAKSLSAPDENPPFDETGTAQLHQVLLDLTTSRYLLQRWLEDRMDRRLADITTETSMAGAVKQVIDAATVHDWLDVLVTAALQEWPHNKPLQRWVAAYMPEALAQQTAAEPIVQVVQAQKPEVSLGKLHEDMLTALGGEPDDIEGIIDQLNQIQDVLKRIPPLYDENPISDFSALYTTITVNIGERHKSGQFSRPAFVNRLQVELCRLYVKALRQWSEGSALTPESWAVLFRRVTDTDLRSLPCAAAGLNAHTSYDLPLALKATWEYLGHSDDGSPQHNDYLQINAVFEECIPSLRSRYLEGWQRFIDRINLGFDDWYQNLFVVVTRNRAWERAQRLWEHRADSAALERMRRDFDAQTARTSRALLSPFARFIQ